MNPIMLLDRRVLHEKILSNCMGRVIGHFFAAYINENFKFADGINTHICTCQDYKSKHSCSLRRDVCGRIGIVCRSMSRMWGKMPWVDIVVKRCDGIRFNWATKARQVVRRTANKYYAVLRGRDIHWTPSASRDCHFLEDQAMLCCQGIRV